MEEDTFQKIRKQAIGDFEEADARYARASANVEEAKRDLSRAETEAANAKTEWERAKLLLDELTGTPQGRETFVRAHRDYNAMKKWAFDAQRTREDQVTRHRAKPVLAKA